MQCARPWGVNLGLGTTCRVSPSRLGASELSTLILILGAAQLTPVGGGLREEGGLRPTSRLQAPRAPTQHSWGQPLRDHPQILLQTDCQRCDCNHLSTFQMNTVQAYMKGYSGMHGVDIDRNQFPNP